MSSTDAEREAETVSERREREHEAAAPRNTPDRPSGPWRVQAAEAFATGTVVDGNYRILDRLGEGAMGVVLRAHDVRLDRDVALKVIRTSALERPDALERFLEEARAMARVAVARGGGRRNDHAREWLGRNRVRLAAGQAGRPVSRGAHTKATK